MLNRRRFVQQSAVVSLTPTLPAFLSEAAADIKPDHLKQDRILVVIQLDGGNDGINTVVPLHDEGYAEHRKELVIQRDDLIPLTDDFAFHPRMKSASELFHDGRLSIVHGVGYPNPNRSHFESMAIWHTGAIEQDRRLTSHGWIGGAMSQEAIAARPHAIHVGTEDLPLALRGRRCAATTISKESDLQLRFQQVARSGSVAQHGDSTNSLDHYLTRTVSDAYLSSEELAAATKRDRRVAYPNSALAERLRLVSQMIKSDTKARVYYTRQAGYDTHSLQLPAHANLLGELSSSLKAFMNDLKASGLDDRVLVMAFSEFGRRVQENTSIGTDHGTAGPVFLAGTKLAQRSYGSMPSLSDLDAGDLRFSTDFRHLYASVLSDWLGLGRPNHLREFGFQGIFNTLS